MKRLLAILLLIIPGSAHATLDRGTLDGVGFSPPVGAHISLALPVRDGGSVVPFAEVLNGQPALLVPVDYMCRTTCGPAIAIASAALSRTGLKAGADYNLILIGIDPAATQDEARAFTQARIGDPSQAAATHPLTLDKDALASLTQALGYTYVPDSDTNSFAHPLGAVALTAQGAVSRLLSPLALDAGDLRLALVEAGEGRVGSWADRLSLLCYGFDAAHGVYTSRIILILRLTGGLALGALAFWVFRMARSRPAGGGEP